MKKILLTCSILGLTTTASAAGITNPFFMPEQLHVLSETRAEFARTQIKNGFINMRTYNTIAQERLTLGVLDNLALTGTFGNTWAKAKERTFGFSESKDKNLTFEGGLSYLVLNDTAKLQLNAAYGQNEAMADEGAYKYINAEVKAGYQAKGMLPYVSARAHLPVGQKKGSDKPSYTLRTGLFQGKCGVWSLDTGLSLEFDTNTDVKTRIFAADMEASYFLTKNVSLSLYGEYVLNGKGKYDSDLYGKRIGATFRFYF